ncbi:unnamed protein product, partial [Polarella glacialis]
YAQTATGHCRAVSLAEPHLPFRPALHARRFSFDSYNENRNNNDYNNHHNNNSKKGAHGPLTGLRVLDMTRVLAGPSCTQVLGDMGAEIIKVERPEVGDDTRSFAPPYLPKNDQGELSDVSAYFAGCNRNKSSLTLDYSKPAGQAVLRRLLKSSDIFVENFKCGTLEKYGMGYEHLKQDFPKLVYCSITGFGHSGPYKSRPGYDALLQAMGGFMSITGEPTGEPMKIGISVVDLLAGLHGVIGILAALRHATETGQGQHVDISMLDVSTAMLANQGYNYLATGKLPERLGNQHPNIVPYQVMPASDGYFMLSVGNDATFVRFVEVAVRADPAAGAEQLLEDPRFKTGPMRVENRELVTDTCNAITRSRSVTWWLEELEKVSVGCSPILNLEQVFDDPHVKARNMLLEMEMPGKVDKTFKTIASPFKFSNTPVSYRQAPPGLGEHSESILKAAGYSEAQVEELRSTGVV